MYVTLLEEGPGWRLVDRAGLDGDILLAGPRGHRAHDASAAERPVLWLCGAEEDSGRSFVLRIDLVSLRQQRLPSPGRVGAISSDPGGGQAVVLQLPETSSGMPRLVRWNGDVWAPLQCVTVPDISSAVTWLPDERVAFESSDRRLCVARVRDGFVESGPAGSQPRATAASLLALRRQQLVRFKVSAPFARGPEAVRTFAARDLVRFSITRDELVLSWSEARALYRSRAYLQRAGEPRRELDVREGALVVVMGPFRP